MTYPDLMDEEIQRLRDTISNTLGNMKSDIRKDKLKVIGKTLLSLIIVASGVAVSVIFPNPVTIGILGGAATLIAGNNSILSKTRRIKEKSKERKKNKEEVRNMGVEQHNRELAKDIQSRIYQQEIVPNLYPDLRQS